MSTSSNLFAEAVRAARDRSPIRAIDPLPWPGPPDSGPPEAVCSCGHPHEQHDAAGRCRCVIGAGFGCTGYCPCLMFILKD